MFDSGRGAPVITKRLDELNPRRYLITDPKVQSVSNSIHGAVLDTSDISERQGRYLSEVQELKTILVAVTSRVAFIASVKGIHDR